MSNLIKHYKLDLKTLAEKIREYKSKRKGAPCGYVSGLSKVQRDFRYKHIAYCMLRGRTYEQIEQPKNPLKDFELKEIKRLMTLEAKMYIVVDGGLSYGQKVVQAVHAATEYLKKYGVAQPRWNNSIIIKESPASVQRAYWDRGMHKWKHKMYTGSGLTLDHVVFKEPDMKDRETALAFIESDEYVPTDVKNLPLLR